MLKIDMVRKLKSLVENVDEESFITSDEKMYLIVNKNKLLSLTDEQLAKRSSKEGLEYMIILYTKHQKEEN